MFDQFLTKARSKGIFFTPLGNFLQEKTAIDSSSIVSGKVPGRDGWISIQDQNKPVC
jgi:hypothetical protein